MVPETFGQPLHDDAQQTLTRMEVKHQIWYFPPCRKVQARKPLQAFQITLALAPHKGNTFAETNNKSNSLHKLIW